MPQSDVWLDAGRVVFPDAPDDGNIYGRKDLAWEYVPVAELAAATAAEAARAAAAEAGIAADLAAEETRALATEGSLDSRTTAAEAAIDDRYTKVETDDLVNQARISTYHFSGWITETDPRSLAKPGERWLDAPAPPPAPVPPPCKLSFRHGGERPFYAALRDTLQSKPWIATETKSRPGLLAVEAASAVEAPPLDAFADLDMLMRQARRMVDFAESLRTELERYERTAPTSGAASSLLQSALVRIGLPSPAVTPDMVKNERAYHRELARELSGVLLGEHGLLGPCDQDTGRGLLPLDEVWGLWNRARGVALVSPKLLRAAVTYLPDMTSPSVRLRTLRSGMPILYTPRFDDAAIEERVLRYLDEAPFLTTTQVAALEGLSALLMRELLEGVEQQTGAVVRDECGTKETRWCRNRMR